VILYSFGIVIVVISCASINHGAFFLRYKSTSRERGSAVKDCEMMEPGESRSMGV
jgi:hypothetical protein